MSSIMRRRRGLISAIGNSCLMRWFGKPTLSDRRPRRQPHPYREAVSFNQHGCPPVPPKEDINDFNADAGTVCVRISKAGKPRHIVLTEEGREFLAGLALGQPGSARFFLRANGKAWGKSEQQRPLTAVCAVARIDPPANFHALRHTYARRLAMRGVPLESRFHS